MGMGLWGKRKGIRKWKIKKEIKLKTIETGAEETHERKRETDVWGVKKTHKISFFVSFDKR